MERLARITRHLHEGQGRGANGVAMKKCSATLAAAEKETDTVLFEVLEGDIGLITLNRPARGNALTQRMQVEYFDALDRANADPAVKVIVVTGQGRHFCVGAEMELLKTIGQKDKQQVGKPLSRPVDQIQALGIPKPIICAVNGSVAGLGMVLALCADVRFCTRHGKWTTAFAKRGLVAEYGISWILPRIVGVSHALDLLLSSRVVQGDEAKDLGLVSKVFDTKEQLLAEALKYARDMARLCSPASMVEMKSQVYADFLKNQLEANEDAKQLMAKSFKHPDVVEGVKSYNEKRDPVFQGLGYGRIKDQPLNGDKVSL